MMPRTTVIKTCSRCGTARTYMQNNYEKWYYINNNNEEDKKERVCKNCYGKVLRTNNKIPTIDLTKVKPSEIKIDDNYSSSNTTTIIASTPPITSGANVVTNKKKRRLDSFEREKKSIEKIRNKRLTKTQRAVVNERNAIPFIENISFKQYGNQSTLCSICSGQLMLLELSIPNYKTVVRLCKTCFEYLFKMIKSLNAGAESSEKIKELTNIRNFHEIEYLQMYEIDRKHTNLTNKMFS